jgi:hypothetical protein
MGRNDYAYVGGNPVSYLDPDGTGPVEAGIGAAVGFAWGFGEGLIEGKSLRDSAINGGIDAAFGALTGLTDGLNLVARIGVNAGISAAGEAYKEARDIGITGCGNLNGTKIAFAAGTGILGDLGGDLGSSAVSSSYYAASHVFEDASSNLAAFLGANISGAINLVPPAIIRLTSGE